MHCTRSTDTLFMLNAYFLLVVVKFLQYTLKIIQKLFIRFNRRCFLYTSTGLGCWSRLDQRKRVWLIQNFQNGLWYNLIRFGRFRVVRGRVAILCSFGKKLGLNFSCFS